MQWYQYSQDISTGTIDRPARLVIIEANSASESDGIAQGHGIYFDRCDGCNIGVDCECRDDGPYYSLDHSIYLVAYGQPGVLTRTVDGALNPDAAALIRRARVEIDAQSAARKLAGR